MKSPMEIKITDEFASAMQQLSAEAEKTLPENSWGKHQNGEQFAQLLSAHTFDGITPKAFHCSDRAHSWLLNIV